MTPLTTAVYWVEYVARHKGAPHLHSAGQDLSFLQYHNLDVFGFIIFAAYMIWTCLSQLVKFVCCRSGGNAETEKTDKKKKRN